MQGDQVFVRSGHLRLWTERFGNRADPAVLLVMGTAAQGIGWPDELVERIVRRGYHVVRFDHRDTGRSDCVDFAAHPYIVADMACDTLAVLDGLGIADAHVAGASLGGTIAQWLAVHRPERVRTLIPIMSSPMGNDPLPALQRAAAGQPPEPGELPPLAERFLRHLNQQDPSPPTREAAIDAAVETWRVLNGETLPFEAGAAGDADRPAPPQPARPPASDRAFKGK